MEIPAALSPLSTSKTSSVAFAAFNRRHSQVDYEEIDHVTQQVKSRTTIKPALGIICGSGLGGLADQIEQKDVIPYEQIKGFPECTVKGHAGNLVFGILNTIPTVCMQGRLHFYEGHPPWLITMPVRLMKLLGVHTIIVTNAAGGLNPDYRAGDIMIIRDHINLAGMTGQNPLIGPNDDRFGERFPALTVAYDKELRALARETAKSLGMEEFLREGVYVHLSGPNYETPSESMFLRMVGADAVGMSTAPEVIVARHAGIRVLGLSLITNEVILDYDTDKEPPCHQEVMETAEKRGKDLQRLVKELVGKINF